MCSSLGTSCFRCGTQIIELYFSSARPVCAVSARRGAVAQVPPEEVQDTVCFSASAHNR